MDFTLFLYALKWKDNIHLVLWSDSPAPIFCPTRIRFPKHIRTSMDDKLQELAENLYQHRNEEQSPELSAPYELPQYPIEEQETRNKFERQISHK